MDKYCEICADICPIDILSIEARNQVFTAYSSKTDTIKKEVSQAIETLKSTTDTDWVEWQKDLEIINDIIYCNICNNIIKSKAILIELSDLNFNVIFEYGYALALNKKIHITVNKDFDFKDIERFFSVFLGVGVGKYEPGKLSVSGHLKMYRLWALQSVPPQRVQFSSF
ncbi:MAG: hypothetical protein K9M55_10415 [Candidatus Marinimicrobia bacterium]|nr:hypothetical protein [Candidatus Neomarinimicrobiota bacterium]